LKGVVKADHSYRPVMFRHGNALQVVADHEPDGIGDPVTHLNAGIQGNAFFVGQQDLINSLTSHGVPKESSETVSL
jgi:hypothetical protein